VAIPGMSGGMNAPAPRAQVAAPAQDSKRYARGPGRKEDGFRSRMEFRDARMQAAAAAAASSAMGGAQGDSGSRFDRFFSGVKEAPVLPPGFPSSAVPAMPPPVPLLRPESPKEVLPVPPMFHSFFEAVYAEALSKAKKPVVSEQDPLSELQASIAPSLPMSHGMMTGAPQPPPGAGFNAQQFFGMFSSGPPSQPGALPIQANAPPSSQLPPGFFGR